MCIKNSPEVILVLVVNSYVEIKSAFLESGTETEMMFVSVHK